MSHRVMRVRKRVGTGDGKILLTRFAHFPSNRTGFCHICRLHRRRQACGERPLQPRPRRGEPCLTAGERSEPAEKAVMPTGLRRSPTPSIFKKIVHIHLHSIIPKQSQQFIMKGHCPVMLFLILYIVYYLILSVHAARQCAI